MNLPRLRSTLRRLFPGKEPRTVLQRRALIAIAEGRCRRPGATPQTVLERIQRMCGRPLTDEQVMQMRLALERDIPGGAT